MTKFELGAGVVTAHWIGGETLFTLVDGSVRIVGAGEARAVQVHDGAILSATLHPDGKRLVTGGDDGKLCAVSPAGDIEVIAELRKWIDHVVASLVTNVIVASVGKQAVVFREGREAHRFGYPSTIGGLAIDAKGRRLAASHYGGVTLRYILMADDKGTTLNWAGSHLAVTLSPDADYAITAMQENSLHGWRLPDKIDLRMEGYPAKTRCFSWDKRGRWLATSGATSAIVWPFVGKLGPQGKPPMQPGEREALVTAVAFHPTEEILAIGYADGAAMAVRFADLSGMDLREANGAAVSAFAWNAAGTHLALADDAGQAAIFDLSAP